jgi:galactose-1-phosphate uridylyltransferase
VIRFKRYTETAALHNPSQNYELDMQPIEYRHDPLTGTVTFIHPRRGRGAYFHSDHELIEQMAQQTQETCFFCPQKVETSTPTFPAELVPQGRLARGEAILFPNLFAQKAYAAVAALSHSHYLRLDEFTPTLFTDAFILAGNYLARVFEVYGARYAEVGCNYLHPSGSSVMHPHIQVIASNAPYQLMTTYMEKGRAYFQRYGSNYWNDLVKKEKRLDERYIGSIGATEWLVPFAPIRHYEIDAIVSGCRHILEFDSSIWEGLAEGLTRVLKAYHAENLTCFNFAVYSGPMGQDLPYFRAGMKIVARAGIQQFPINDVWYGPNLLGSGFITRPPEEVAALIKPFFKK